MANQTPAIVIDQAHLGGIADSVYSGDSGSLASLVGFDIHSVPGLMLVNQKMAAEDTGVDAINDLCTIVPASDGNIYYFGKTTGKVWKKEDGTYSLLGTVPLTTYTAYASPATVANDASVGTEPWIDPTNVTTDDDNYAAVDIGTGLTSQYLKATNFGFNLPSTATVLGIQVEVDQFGDQPTWDSKVHIVKGGTIQTTQNMATATPWPDPSEYATYGGEASLWSTSWTYSDINSSGFGVAISVTGTSGIANIDHIRIKVWYSDSSEGAEILDAKEYYGNIYYPQAGYFMGKWEIGTAFSARDDQWAKFTNGNADHHPMEDQNLVLYIGDGNTVAQVDSSTGDGTPIFSAQALDLESSMVIQALGKLGTDLVVGTAQESGENKAGVYQWNTISVSFTVAHYIDETGINAFIRLPDGSLLVNAGINGNMYIYTGNALARFKQVPPNFPTLYSPTNTGKVYHGAVANKQGIPIFGFSRITGNPALQGIYSYGSRSVMYPQVLALEFPASNGNLSNLTIYSMAVVGNDIYASIKDETSGTTYLIDKLDWSTKINGAYYETRVMKYSQVLLDNFVKTIVNYQSLPEGTSITASYKINHAAAYTAFQATELRNDEDRKQFLTNISLSAKTIQFKIAVTTSGNTAPTIEDFITLVE